MSKDKAFIFLKFQNSCEPQKPTKYSSWGPNHMAVQPFFFLIFFSYLFIFGCVRSLLLSKLLSSCGKWRPLSSCGAKASHCGDLLLQSTSSRVCRIYNFMLVSAVQQSDSGIYIYILYYIYIRLFPIIDYYKILNIVLCAIQQDTVVCLFYIQQCVSVNPMHACMLSCSVVSDSS